MSPLVPGEVLPAEGTVELNPGRPCTHLVVENAGDRPVQVGSHYHFAAANPALRFDRAAAWGLRLDIPAGTAVRFEPGVTREVALVPLAGRRVVPGLRAELAGPLDGPGTPRTAAGGPAAGGPAAGGPAAGGPAAGGPGGGGADRG